MPELDLRPAAARMAALLQAVPDDALDGPTPCAGFPLRELLQHVGGFAVAFTAAARKGIGPLTAPPPTAAPQPLEPGWRARMAQDLAMLGDAWQDPDAWTGMTQAGGVDLPGEVAARVALDELVVHGWDVARSTAQPFECDEESLREIEATVRRFRGGVDGAIPGLFGPAVPVPEDASMLDRVVALTGRDPGWTP